MAFKIQSMKALKAEMLAVAKGTRRAPANAGKSSFDSADAVIRLLTPTNRQLLAAIETSKPASVAELARTLGRAEPNISRTLAKLVAAGFVQITPGPGKSKIPKLAIHRVTVNIDVCQYQDRITVA